jgi:hypothetical protein
MSDLLSDYTIVEQHAGSVTHHDLQKNVSKGMCTMGGKVVKCKTSITVEDCLGCLKCPGSGRLLPLIQLTSSVSAYTIVHEDLKYQNMHKVGAKAAYR